jgi:hypothetical protein
MYIAVAQQKLYKVAVATDVESEQSAGYRRVQGGRVHSRCLHSGRYTYQRERDRASGHNLGKIPFESTHRTTTF